MINVDSLEVVINSLKLLSGIYLDFENYYLLFEHEFII